MRLYCYFFNTRGLILRYGLAKMIKIIYNDIRKKCFKVSKLAIERVVTQVYMISQGNMCRVVQILFSNLWPDIYLNGKKRNRIILNVDEMPLFFTCC